MDTVVNFQDNLDEGTSYVTTDKVKTDYIIQKHKRFPSLYIIESTNGPTSQDLKEMFTSMEDAKNFMRRYLEKKKYSTRAYYDKKATKNESNSKGTGKVQQRSHN